MGLSFDVPKPCLDDGGAFFSSCQSKSACLMRACFEGIVVGAHVLRG